MNVALVVKQMNVLCGGLEIYTARLATSLAQRGHTVTILCQAGSWQPPCDGITLEPLGRAGGRGGRRLRTFVAAVERAAANGRFDVVHAMLPVPGADLYHPHGGTAPGATAGSLRRRPTLLRPVVRLVNTLNTGRRAGYRLERRIVTENRTLCLCVSERVAEEFRRHYDHTRTRVVFNSVPSPPPHEVRLASRQRLRGELGIGPEALVLITAAMNFELKGVTEEIKAFARWTRSRDAVEAHLVLVGREHVDRYRRLARRHGVEAVTHFIAPTEDIYAWYAAADAAVLLTWYDTCGMMVLEAARFGVPSLTTRFSGAAGIFTDGGCLVVDSPRHTDQIIDALNTLADPDERRRHGEACRRLDAYLTMDRHVEELMNIYSVVSRHQGNSD